MGWLSYFLYKNCSSCCNYFNPSRFHHRKSKTMEKRSSLIILYLQLGILGLLFRILYSNDKTSIKEWIHQVPRYHSTFLDWRFLRYVCYLCYSTHRHDQSYYSTQVLTRAESYIRKCNEWCYDKRWNQRIL